MEVSNAPEWQFVNASTDFSSLNRKDTAHLKELDFDVASFDYSHEVTGILIGDINLTV